jgi:hypothetical protein
MIEGIISCLTFSRHLEKKENSSLFSTCTVSGDVVPDGSEDVVTGVLESSTYVSMSLMSTCVSRQPTNRVQVEHAVTVEKEIE